MSIGRNKIKSRTHLKQTWMTKDLEQSLSKLSGWKIVSKYLKLYCRISTLNSLKYLADSRRPWFERILWVIIHCIIISGVVLMVYISYNEFVTTPLVTSMESDSYKTTSLDFPGISICSINRISKQSATELATDIFNANVTNQSVDEIRNLIVQLGNLYPSIFDMDMNLNVEIHQLLTTYYNGHYDITKILKDLTPKCSMILLKCKLHGIYRNCSEIFEFRKTQNGYCCTFNYAREDDDIPEMDDNIEPIEVQKVFDLGIERGLTVVMDPLLNDYFYSLMPVVGWKVVVFNPTDFPDMTSGGVTEVLAMPLSETFLDVTTTSFISTPVIENYPKDKRNCIFKDEGNTIYASTLYTYSDCIVYCKIDHIQHVCGCRPFFYPRRGRVETKLQSIFPREDKSNILQKGKNVLQCHECYPACEDTKYDVLSWKSYMTPGGFNTNLLWNYNVTDEGVLHVYFSKYGTIRLKQGVSFYWYELLSDVGGICGIFIGFSFISIIELLYFFVLVSRDLLCKKSALQEDDDGRNKSLFQTVRTQTIRAIYWNELQPRTWHSAKFGKFSTNRARY